MRANENVATAFHCHSPRNEWQWSQLTQPAQPTQAEQPAQAAAATQPQPVYPAFAAMAAAVAAARQAAASSQASQEHYSSGGRCLHSSASLPDGAACSPTPALLRSGSLPSPPSSAAVPPAAAMAALRSSSVRCSTGSSNCSDATGTTWRAGAPRTAPGQAGSLAASPRVAGGAGRWAVRGVSPPLLPPPSPTCGAAAAPVQSPVLQAAGGLSDAMQRWEAACKRHSSCSSTSSLPEAALHAHLCSGTQQHAVHFAPHGGGAVAMGRSPSRCSPELLGDHGRPPL